MSDTGVYPSVYSCQQCGQILSRSGHSSTLLVCPSCRKYLSLQTVPPVSANATAIISNNSRLQAGKNGKESNSAFMLLGLHQVYYHNSYCNYWYFEPKGKVCAYLEESYGAYYYLQPLPGNYSSILTKGKTIVGRTFTIEGQPKLLCTAVRKVVISAEAGELQPLQRPGSLAFVIEAVCENNAFYRFFIATDKTIAAFKGKATTLKDLQLQ